MRSAAFAFTLILSLVILPFLYDQSGQFRFTATPTPLEVMEGIPGALVDQAPRQVELLPDQSFTIDRDGYRITARDRFELHGLVLGRKDYSSDRAADLSPMDLAIGWGVMSDPTYLKLISVRQSNRFYFLRWDEDKSKLQRAQISFNSSNMHMVPASEDVARKLEGVRPGEIVHIDGYLIDVTANDGWRWKTSRTRIDTGAGACEIILVEDVSIRTFGKNGEGQE